MRFQASDGGDICVTEMGVSAAVIDDALISFEIAYWLHDLVSTVSAKVVLGHNETQTKWLTSCKWNCEMHSGLF